MEIVAHILLSIIGSAVIAGVIKVVAAAFHQDEAFLMLWFVVFCAWWGVIFIGSCS